MSEDLHPSLRNIVDQESLNWIFVGGKGACNAKKTPLPCLFTNCYMHDDD